MSVLNIETNVELNLKEKSTFIRGMSKLLSKFTESEEVSELPSQQRIIHIFMRLPQKIFVKYNNTEIISGGIDKPSAHVQLSSAELVSPSSNRVLWFVLQNMFRYKTD